MAPSPRLELDPSDVCLGASGSPPTKSVDRSLAGIKKKLTPEDLLLFDEEAHIRDDPASGATWFLRGHQKKVRTTGRHAAAILMGTVAPATGDVIVEEYEESTADTFHQFLQVILHRYPGKQIYLILDHAKIHHAQVLAPFLADHPARHLLFLPPYSPHWNNVERLWKWLREKVILNTYFPDLAAINTAIQCFLRFLKGVPIEIRSRLCRLPGDTKKN